MRKSRICFGLVFLILGLASFSARAIDIGPMTWTPRSDWLNVKTGCSGTSAPLYAGPYAAGNGTTDDTAAIQAAMNWVMANHYGHILTIYFPPGTYNISNTLTLTGIAGGGLVGCGSNTIISWYGGSGGAMFHPSATGYMHYIGLTWEGNNLAACAYEHYSPTSYETQLRHEFESFKDITVTGTYIAGSSPPGCALISGFDLNMNNGGLTADSMMYNCAFHNCTTGYINAYQDFNNFCWVIDSCEFENCGTCINCFSGACWTVSNCHFQNSSVADIGGGGAMRIRHCTSEKPALFATNIQGNSILQDCWVDGWTNVNNAVQFAGGYGMMGAIFDCTFTNAPSGAIRLLSAGGTIGQAVTLSNNYMPNFPGGLGSLTSSPYTMEGQFQYIQPGLRYGPVGLLLSATQTFLHTGGSTDSTHIIDVTQPPYTADPTNVHDSTATIQAAINAAQAANNGSVVYIPNGIYKISSMLSATGSNFNIQGSGVYSELCWYGATSGTMLSITTPANIEVQKLRFAQQSGSTTDIFVTSTQACSLVLDDVIAAIFNTGNPGALFSDGDSPGVVLTNLPAGSTVSMPHTSFPINVQNCSAAQIYSKFFEAGMFTISGTTPKTGFLGSLASECGQNGLLNGYNITINDNQNLVMQDWYYEQCRNGIDLERGAGTSPGYVAIQGFNAEAGLNNGANNAPTIQITANNYQGTLDYAWTPFANNTGTSPVQITQTGSNPFNMLLDADYYNDGPPVITTSNANVVQSQNVSRLSGTSSYVADNPNPLSGADLALLAGGFDPFRQLEAVDFSFQFGMAPPDGPPVAAYAFEGDATDMTGNYNATNYGATYGIGAVGLEAADFDGAGAYIQAPNSAGSGNFSISMWVQTRDTGGTGQWYAGHGLVDGETGANAADFGTALCGGRFAFGIGGPDTTLLTTGTVNDNRWHYLVATYNSISGAMQVFVDGTLNNTASGPAGARSAAAALRFGGIQSGLATGCYNGLLDQVEIYNYVLTSTEVAYKYNHTSGGNSLVGYWKLNETSGTTSSDFSSYGENGNQINGPTPSAACPPAIAYSNSGSLLFNGVNQFVKVPTTTALPNYQTPRTLSAWARTVTLSGTHMIIVSGSSGTNNSFYIGQFGTTLDVGGMNDDITYPNFWDTNWHHLVATYDGSTGNVYADGALVASAAKPNWSHLVPPVYCTIGAFVTGTSYPFSGNIADVRIYNRALTAAEVANMDVPVPAITSTSSATGTQGQPFSYQITASNTPATYAAAGLPSGLSVNLTSGLISGMAAASGTSTATISAANASGSSSAPLTLVMQTPIAAWQLGYFGPNAPESIAGDSVVNNSAGITNLMAYALNVNPFTAAATNLPVLGTTMVSGSNYLTLSFTRNSLATDLTYTVQASGILTNPNAWTPIDTFSGGAWSPAGNVTETGSAPAINVQVRDSQPILSATSRFLRLEVTH